MQEYDLCLAWNWKYDYDFIERLEYFLHTRGLSLLQVNLNNVDEILEKFQNNEITFRVFWNRTYGSEKEFNDFVHWAGYHATYFINAYDKSIVARDKAVMHYVLIKAGIYTPYSFILPSYNDQPELSPPDLEPLKENFIIKPANGGGGEGVVLEANSLQEILDSRQEYPEDRYLVQSQINPVNIKGHPAWFRVIYCAGRIYPCWWHPQSHIYTPLDENDAKQYQLNPLREITQTIAYLTDLDFFSTEIALTAAGEYIVVDYVNDEIDLRLKSKTPDGVPDEIINDICERMAIFVSGYRRNEKHDILLDSLHSC